jgi:uncharacterized protein Yka (UPF0111/DUF47 family)
MNNQIEALNKELYDIEIEIDELDIDIPYNLKELKRLLLEKEKILYILAKYDDTAKTM